MAEKVVQKRSKTQPGKNVPEPQPDWLQGTLRKFKELRSLPENWDGYNARSVDPIILERALQVLVEVVPPAAPVPHVVPSPSGGIQVEWHERSGDIELEFKVDGTASFFMETDEGEIEEYAPAESIAQLVRGNLNLVLTSP